MLDVTVRHPAGCGMPNRMIALVAVVAVDRIEGASGAIALRDDHPAVGRRTREGAALFDGLAGDFCIHEGNAGRIAPAGVLRAAALVFGHDRIRHGTNAVFVTPAAIRGDVALAAEKIAGKGHDQVSNNVLLATVDGADQLHGRSLIGKDDEGGGCGHRKNSVTHSCLLGVCDGMHITRNKRLRLRNVIGW